jgi:orotate phosphoribosyltransferase
MEYASVVGVGREGGMTIADETRALLEEAGALKRGHFILSSGLHSDRYCQCAALFERPDIAAKVAGLLKRSLPTGLRVDVVLSPALGGVLWGYELSRVLGCRNVFAERLPGAAFELKRGFDIRPGEHVLLAEDVVTTGGSVSELVPLVSGAGAHVAGFAVIADRSRGAFKPGAPLFALTTLDFETFKPEALPERLRSIPAVKPGSRVKVGGAT